MSESPSVPFLCSRCGAVLDPQQAVAGIIRCEHCGTPFSVPHSPATSSNDIIIIENLEKRFGQLKAVNGVSLRVARGSVVVIIGPSGSGKSTVLRCINHLETPTGGTITVDGMRLTHNSKDINAIRSEVGMVFQQFNLFPHLTAIENILLAQRIVRKRSPEEAKKIALQQLERVGIPEKAHSYPGQLSGGQQQRVAIARALAMQPKIMLFDEPTSALDPEMIKEVLDVMQDLAKSGMTMVCVTHEMGFARNVAHEIVFMDKGQVVERGDPKSFFTHPREERTRTFLSQILH